MYSQSFIKHTQIVKGDLSAAYTKKPFPPSDNGSLFTNGDVEATAPDLIQI